MTDDTVERLKRILAETAPAYKIEGPDDCDVMAEAVISALQECESTIVDNLSEEITALRNELDAQQWQDISTAPRDGTEVDLWIVPQGISGSGPDRIPDCWFSESKWWRYDEQYGDGYCRSEVHNATHWMHKPAPPETGE